MKKYTYVRGEDWEGLYVNGVLVREGHSLSPWALLDILVPGEFDIKEVDQSWIESHDGMLPTKLTEVQVV